MNRKWFSGEIKEWFLDDLLSWFFDDDYAGAVKPEVDYWTDFTEWEGVVDEVCQEDMDEYQIVRAICLECGESLNHCVCY